jgi:hypothetical protein
MYARRLVFLCLLTAACSGARNNGGGKDLSANPGADLWMTGSTDLANGGCATALYEAKQAPAAMLVLLDRSASMADQNKWTFAAQATVQAIDQDIFDTMYLGLMASPSGTRMGPQCIFGLDVACQSPPFPQIDLKLAGNLKSADAMGVRHDIKAWVTQNLPDNGQGDASPLYDATQAAIISLQGWAMNGKRILFIVTDGTLSCCQFSNRAGFPDCNGCTHDWEHPNNLVTLLGNANKDPNKPVETFIVGVPGADTFDAQGCNYPPYHMRAALSAIAFAGSPGNVPANCTGKTFAQNSPDPAVSCHVDLTQGNFNAAAIANKITEIRGKVLGCVFDLPTTDGGMVDLNDVNVNYTVNGGAQIDLKKRADPMNQCVAEGCWDYTVDNKVQLIGKACDDIKGQMNAQVKIVLGCPTIIG